MIAEYFHCTTALSESVGKIGSASKHQVSFSIPQQFRSTNIRFDEITVGYLHDLECSCPEWKQEQLDSPKFDVLKAVYNKVFTEGISPRCTHSKVDGEVILQ